MRLTLNHILVAFGLSLTASAGFSTVYAQDASFPASEPYDPETSEAVEKAVYSTPPPMDGEVRNPARTVILSSAPKDSTSLTGRSAHRASKSSSEPARNTGKEQENTTTKQEKQEKKNQDDSILSFNFLYYIFQKYKLQDIVD